MSASAPRDFSVAPQKPLSLCVCSKTGGGVARSFFAMKSPHIGADGGNDPREGAGSRRPRCREKGRRLPATKMFLKSIT